MNWPLPILDKSKSSRVSVKSTNHIKPNNRKYKNMSRQTLKDKNHRIIGYIEQRSDGTLVGLDANHRIKGYYMPKTNKTEDSNHRAVGTGNLLSVLILQ